MNEQEIPIDSVSKIYVSNSYPWVESLLHNPGQTSTTKYLSLLMVGLVLLAVFIVMRKIVIPLIKRRTIKEAFERIIPIVEAITALIFAMVSIFYLILPYPLLGLIFLGIIVAGSWGFLKDYFSGLLFRFSDNFRPGHRIKIDKRSGLILNMGRLGAEIEIEGGEVLIMPYSKMANASLIRESQSEKVLSYALEVNIPAKVKETDLKEYLRGKILSLPWSVAGKDPFLEKINTKEGNTYRVVLYAMSEKYFPLMEEKLLQEL